MSGKFTSFFQKHNILFAILLTVLFLVIFSIILPYINYSNFHKINISQNGKYLTTDKNFSNKIIANRNNVSLWEDFYVEKVENSEYRIQSFEKKYLVFNKDSQLYGNSENVDSGIVFSVRFSENNSAVLSIPGKNIRLTPDNILYYSNINPAKDFIVKIEHEPFRPGGFNFSDLHFWMLAVTVLLLLSGYYFHFVLMKHKSALLLLLLSAIVIKIFAVTLTPYIHYWDEIFHALVAKNTMNDFLKPTFLNNPVLGYNPLNWAESHVWLHKQPLFIWQIALFFKIFSTHAYVLRMPSAIMSILTIWFVYDIAKKTISVNVAFVAAMLCVVNIRMLELITGITVAEHNDTAFIFYVVASIWAWINFNESKKKYWIFLIGIFAGCAILTKWLVGLLVFSAWAVLIFLKYFETKKIAGIKFFVTALFITIVIALPWQIYTHVKYPVEASYEAQLSAKHFTTVVEAHSGDNLFYFDDVSNLYQFNKWLVLAVIILLFFSLRRNPYRLMFFTFLIVVYLFFTMAKTKMSNFVFIVSPIVFIAIANFAESLSYRVNRLKKTGLTQLFHFTIVMLIVGFSFNIFALEKQYSGYSAEYNRIAHITSIAKKLDAILTNEKSVIFTKDLSANPYIMFYSKFPAYKLSEEKYILAKQNKMHIIVIKEGELPDYIMSDTSVVIL